MLVPFDDVDSSDLLSHFLLSFLDYLESFVLPVDLVPVRDVFEIIGGCFYFFCVEITCDAQRSSSNELIFPI